MIFKAFSLRRVSGRYDITVGCLDEKYIEDEVDKLIDRMKSKGSDQEWHHIGPFIIRVKKSLKK